MNNFFSYLRLLLLATSGMLLLCIIFAMNPELADSTLSGKVCWFHFTSLLLAGGVLLMEFTTRKSRFIFSLPDALLLLLFGIVLVSYDKDENLQPERFLFIAQLVALWFMLRGALQAHQELYARFSLRSSYSPESFQPSGGSAILSILLPSPIRSSDCLKHR